MTESGDQLRRAEQRRKMDEAIDRTEKMVSSLSIGEVNLKLVLTTAHLTDNVNALSDTVSELTNSVSTLTQDVNGGEGVRATIKDLRHDLRDTDKKIQAVSESIESGMAILWRVVWFLCLVGAIAVVTEIRSFAPILLGGK